jgi:hypothetical protein
VNKVKVGFFSFTQITEPTAHRAYNEWHQLDHMPEQFPIPGVVYGQRWVSTPACRAARAVDEELLAPVHYVTLYLMADPVDRTLRDFNELGQQLRALGRFFDKRRAALSGPLQWLDAHAAPRVLVHPEAVPYRPNQGVYLIVEEPAEGADRDTEDAWIRRLHEQWADEVCALPGVAGVWQFASSPALQGAGWSPGRRRITVCYLDRAPLDVAEAIRPLLDVRWREAPVRPIHAGAFETVVPYQWDWFEGSV